MAFEEYIKKAISTGVRYGQLPERVRATLSLAEYKSRVREYCIQKGLPWDSSMAHEICTEQDYDDELIRTYKTWARLYPYHLAHFIARVMRITPFKYYCDVLFMTLKEEKSYDRIPNFTAADALRVTGVGRNEYISIMNACKAKKLMWRVNKGIAKDLLPAVPLDVKMEGWWIVNVVNVGDAEFRDLSQAEASLLRQACQPQQPQPQQQGAQSQAGFTSIRSGSSSSGAHGHTVSSFDGGLLQQLYKRGVIYLDVPVTPADRLSVPPLEGFVSNKTSEVGDESVDPFEPLLYNLFLANSNRMDQARMADILGVELQQLLIATSIAIRLGFATRLSIGTDEYGGPLRGYSSNIPAVSQSLTIPDSDTESATPTAAAAAAAAGSSLWDERSSSNAAGVGVGESDGAGAIAVVVDSEATSYLMMGALSPGLKRHSVTLFEGGRVGGDAVIDELIAELAASAQAGQAFQGDMVQLMRHIQSLGILLSTVRSAAAAQGQQLELLRKESLESLDPARAAKILSHAYSAIIPIAPMPGPPLPIRSPPISNLGQSTTPRSDRDLSNLSDLRSDLNLGAQIYNVPTWFGPTAASDSPWLSLALYAAAGCGPVCVVLPAGVRVTKLPLQLEGVSHALLWPWSGSPVLAEGSSLLCSLNELLCRTAVVVQPVVYSRQLTQINISPGISQTPVVSFIDVPLPLCLSISSTSPAAAAAVAVDGSSGSTAASPISSATAAAANSSSTVQQQQQQIVLAVDRQTGQLRQFVVPDYVTRALQQLQLTSAIGWLRLVKLPSSSSSSRGAKPGSNWLPLTVTLGVPLFCPVLCQQICHNMTDKQSLTAAGQSGWKAAQQQLEQQLWQMIRQYGVTGSSSSSSEKLDPLQQGRSSDVVTNPADLVTNQDLGQPASAAAAAAAVIVDLSRGLELPVRCLLFDGNNLLAVDLGDCMQGVQL